MSGRDLRYEGLKQCDYSDPNGECSDACSLSSKKYPKDYSELVSRDAGGCCAGKVRKDTMRYRKGTPPLDALGSTRGET